MLSDLDIGMNDWVVHPISNWDDDTCPTADEFCTTRT